MRKTITEQAETLRVITEGIIMEGQDYGDARLEQLGWALRDLTLKIATRADIDAVLFVAKKEFALIGDEMMANFFAAEVLA